MFGGRAMSMRVYISYNKTHNGARVAYACVVDGIESFYYKRFDKSSSEQDAFEYIMKYINNFLNRDDETIFIISNNKKIVSIMNKLDDTENISYIGRYDGEEARDVFMKLQVAISMREKNND